MTEGMLAGGVAAIPEFRPAQREVFAERAARWRTLARGHPMQAYLEFLAELADAQHDMIGAASSAVPDDAEIERCRQHGLPPLSIDAPRDGTWRAVLARILDRLARGALTSEATAAVEVLRRGDANVLEQDASNLLAGAFSDVEPARQPFVAAALQVDWVARALALGARARSPRVEFGLCPVCGSPPVASAVRSGGAAQGLRFLVCSLCASEWHAVRIKCSHCASTKGISYLYVEGKNDAVKAECCDECRTYLKIFYLDKDNRIVPVADDLASLALDLLVDQRGYRRLGPNLLFAPGV